jgi:AraC-like DNA-binding protein
METQKSNTKIGYESQTVHFSFSAENIVSVDERFIKKVKAYIEFNINNPELDVDKLSLEIGMCRSQLYRRLKALTGYPPNVYIRLYRLEKAYLLIERGYGNVSEVAFETGFENLSYFTKCFLENFKLLPSELKYRSNI